MNKDVNNGQSRREFLGRSVAALAAASFLPSAFSCTGKSVAAPAPVDTAAEAGKVNSKFGGVQIGTITYSWRSMPGGLENIIKYCQEANISSIELMGGDLEADLGAPENPMMKFFRRQASQPAAKPGEKPAAPRRMGPPKFTPEQQAEIDKYKEEVKAWRLGLDLSKVEGARKLLSDAGISVHIVKMQPSGMGSDEEVDYAFKVAKAMGAQVVVVDINDERLKLAKETGADQVVNTRGMSQEEAVQAILNAMGGKGAHHMVEATAVPSAIKTAMLAVRGGGQVAQAAVANEINFDSWFFGPVDSKIITFIRMGNVSNDIIIPVICDLYKKGQFPLEKIITYYKFEDILQAMDDCVSGKVIKPVLLFD